MDVIINIIIVMVVVFSILKRFQEVGQKSTEVKRPVPPVRERPNAAPLPHVTGEAAAPEPAMATPVPAEKTQPPEVRSIKDLFDYVQQEFKDAAEQHNRPELTPAPEPAALYGEFEHEPAVPETESRTVSESIYKTSTSQQTVPGVSPSLTFSSGQVVNGIILSEILGPPVALRNEPGPGISF